MEGFVLSKRVAGKVAFITGAARGQGRSHAVRLAEEGAEIIAVDICEAVEGIDLYPGATEADLKETARLVAKAGQRIIARKADVRDADTMAQVVNEGVAEFGRLDIVCANAGVFDFAPALEQSEAMWKAHIGVNLTGVWNTCKVALPHILKGGRGGSVIITSSTAGTKGNANTLSYNASKHGVVGIMKTLANEFGAQNVRVNAIHPGAVDTPLIQNEKTWGLFDPSNPHPTRKSAAPHFQSTNVLPVPWIQPDDVSDAVVWLASDEARYVTGASLPVDAGFVIR